MNYEILKNKIFYSKYMKTLQGKMSPIPGYSDAGSYARDHQMLSNLAAVNNGLDANYCSVLSLAQFLGIPPYGNEGRIAIEEVLGEQFNLTEINLNRLADIAGEPIEERLKKDLKNLASGGNKGGLSNEAMCVNCVTEVLDAYSLLTPIEKEKLGGSVLKTTMITGMKIGQEGLIEKSNLQQKIESAVSGRKKGIDIDIKNKITDKLKKKVISSVLDEQSVIENILGE